ncbi:MAG: hypothetical protein WCS89_01930 [Candidatus Paceibacterota bacterium]|jgi:hypothetical protein
MNINNSVKVALACFMGAFIGALVALQFHYVWWIGVLIGGMVGYISYNLDEIPCAVKKVWVNLSEIKTATKAFFEDRESIVEIIGLTTFLSIGSFLLISLLASAIQSIESTFILWNNLLQNNQLNYLNPRSLEGKELNGLIFLNINIIVIGLIFLLISLLWRLKARNNRTKSRNDLIKNSNSFLISGLVYICLAPIVAPVVIVLVSLIFSAVVIYVSAKISLKVVWGTFKLIHSDIRILCMTDAMIGATIGYYSGNALFGGIVGAIFGVLNYEIISKRWFKLVTVSKEISQA